MPTQITKFDAGVATVFSAINAICFAEEVPNYATATLKTMVGWKSLISIKDESINFTGDALAQSDVKDIVGNVITTTSVQGTNKIEFTVCNTSAAMMTTFLKANDLTVGNAFITGDAFAAGSTVHGFGSKLASIIRPITLFNDALNQAICYPKAQIVAQPVLDSKVFAIKFTITALDLATSALESVMVVRGAGNFA